LGHTKRTKEVFWGLEKNLDRDYTSVNNQISDKQFDQLESNLLRIDPKNDYFNKKVFLPSLSKGREDVFLEKLLPDTRLIIAPKIDGCAIALSYRDGTLKKAISRRGKDVTNAIRTVENIPQSISIRSTLHVRGELFGRGFSPANSQRLASGLFRKRDPDGQGLSFCSYQILNGELNYFSSLQSLESLGFEIPETEFTNYTSDVEHYRILWKEGKLFTDYPTDGIVLTVNSRKLQKQLNNQIICSDWQYAIVD
tara:strand:+ start:732 stop:1490 length:759 start_codon:yes stop_codon:yes gene_type:complete